MKLVGLSDAKHDIARLYNFLVAKSPNAAEKSMIIIDEYVDSLLS